MLFTRYLPRALPVYLSAFKSYSTMVSAVPSQSFQLDRSIFNDTLYTHVLRYWYAGLPAASKHGNAITAQRWWGAGRTDEERDRIDEECRTHFGPALRTLGPDKLALPPWKSYADDLEHAAHISAPFLAEVKAAQQEDDKKGADTALSLVLLLDQMPRNAHREPEGLRLIYNHYDRLAWTFLQSLLAMKPSPIQHTSFKASVVTKSWFALPLMHAEDTESQQAGLELIQQLERECIETGDEDIVKDVNASLGAAKSHKSVIDRYGRFPHRNECLGRVNKKEEEEYLKTGETFGVKQGQKDNSKDEL